MISIVTKLNFTVSIRELQDYYNTLVRDYQHLKWCWENNGGDIIPLWQERIMSEPGTQLPYGWAIQSNIEDLTIPCPPYNITNHKRVEYRNTELAFGIIERLQAAMPYCYRWSMAVMPPGGKVVLHSDQEDEFTVWIPIYADPVPLITFEQDNMVFPINMDANGSAYLLDTTIPHHTHNEGQTTRVALIFRFNQKHTNDILEVTGRI